MRILAWELAYKDQERPLPIPIREPHQNTLEPLSIKSSTLQTPTICTSPLHSTKRRPRTPAQLSEYHHKMPRYTRGEDSRNTEYSSPKSSPLNPEAHDWTPFRSPTALNPEVRDWAPSSSSSRLDEGPRRRYASLFSPSTLNPSAESWRPSNSSVEDRDRYSRYGSDRSEWKPASTTKPPWYRDDYEASTKSEAKFWGDRSRHESDTAYKHKPLDPPSYAFGQQHRRPWSSRLDSRHDESKTSDATSSSYHSRDTERSSARRSPSPSYASSYSKGGRLRLRQSISPVSRRVWKYGVSYADVTSPRR